VVQTINNKMSEPLIKLMDMIDYD